MKINLIANSFSGAGEYNRFVGDLHPVQAGARRDPQGQVLQAGLQVQMLDGERPLLVPAGRPGQRGEPQQQARLPRADPVGGGRQGSHAHRPPRLRPRRVAGHATHLQRGVLDLGDIAY